MVMFLLLETGMLGTFCAMDFFMFYIFWELMLLPMYFLIGIWGGPRKEYAAIKFFLYTLAGSVLMLLCMIGLYYTSGPGVLADGTPTQHTFNIMALSAMGQGGLFAKAAPILGFAFSKIIFVGLFIGFAIKVPMFPFHTWLPDAHVEAPTPISVILAGILLKTGAYGMIRFNFQILPEAAMWAAGGHRPVRNDQHRVRRVRVPRPARPEEDDRVLLDQPHGIPGARDIYRPLGKMDRTFEACAWHSLEIPIVLHSSHYLPEQLLDIYTTSYRTTVRR